jgi:hypothetical protein
MHLPTNTKRNAPFFSKNYPTTGIFMMRIFGKKFQLAVSRMISRSGVCGLNFTKRSSFSISGLRW